MQTLGIRFKLVEIPTEHAEKLIDRGIRDIIEVAKMLDAGYELHRTMGRYYR